MVSTLQIIRPEDALAENCPVLVKSRSVIARKGVSSVVEWQLRDDVGNPINLSDVDVAEVDSANSVSVSGLTVLVRFADAVYPVPLSDTQVSGSIYSATDGLIRFELPDNVKDTAGIYQFEIALYNVPGQMIYSQSGLLSVERGLFGDVMQTTGPLSLNEVRLQMRDSIVENTLLSSLEYSDAEIVHSLRLPLEQFNDMPPPITQKFTAVTFPWRSAWLNACCANLMKIAAHHYRRNKLMTSQGGLTVNDKDRDNPYLQTAMAMQQEWTDFCLVKKAQINAAACFGTVNSNYGLWY